MDHDLTWSDIGSGKTSRVSILHLGSRIMTNGWMVARALWTAGQVLLESIEWQSGERVIVWHRETAHAPIDAPLESASSLGYTLILQCV